jgi:hypothetical protein
MKKQDRDALVIGGGIAFVIWLLSRKDEEESGQPSQPSAPTPTGEAPTEGGSFGGAGASGGF